METEEKRGELFIYLSNLFVRALYFKLHLFGFFSEGKGVRGKMSKDRLGNKVSSVFIL